MASYGPVERAVRAELRRRGVSMADSTLGATMVVLAQNIDFAKGAVAAAAAALQLRETRATLIEELERQPAGDVVDELNARRADRRPAAAPALGSAERVQRGRPRRGDS